MLKVVEAFSGIGSQAKALQKLGIDYKILNTIEWDISAFYAYDIIHNGLQDLSPYKRYNKSDLLQILSKHSLSSDGGKPISMNFLKTCSEDALRRIICAYERTNNLGSITSVKAEMLPKRIDLLTYSFPCQDLSICGSWHGNMSGIDRNVNNHSGLLWEIDRLLREMKLQHKRLPKFLLMENVKNILSNKHMCNFKEWQDILVGFGYINKVYTLDASNFGNPQKRVRTYMLSVLCNNNKRRRIVENYFSKKNLETMKPLPLRPVMNYLRTNYSNPIYRAEAEGSNPNNTKSRRKIFDLNEKIFDRGPTTSKINTLTTKQDRHPTSGLILYPEHKRGRCNFRYLTPRECFLLMGFDEEDFSRVAANNFLIRMGKRFYGREKLEKLAGNSIVVDVLIAIFRQVTEIKGLLWPESRNKKKKQKILKRKKAKCQK